MINKYHTRYCSVPYRSSCPEVFCKKGVLRKYNVSSNFIKKETLAHVFSCGFCEISKKTFFYWTPPVAASVVRRNTKHKKMKTRESKERKFEKRVREIG